MDWFDREVDKLEKLLDNDEITYEEFKAEMRELNNERQAEAEEAAKNAYNDVMGGW